mmetsp:Transcript_16324/g.24704  ORF Transcript_16324/g.24704 Transcript_16324/m.24704 type:complete len:131 (+) Transcript_16324:153-545(+)
MKKSTRTFLEVTVGTTHNLEVILHVRQSDSEWYFSRHDEIIGLLSSRVIPREFETEITDYHKKSQWIFTDTSGRKKQISDYKYGERWKEKEKTWKLKNHYSTSFREVPPRNSPCFWRKHPIVVSSTRYYF